MSVSQSRPQVVIAAELQPEQMDATREAEMRLHNKHSFMWNEAGYTFRKI
jgi:hypothetical protein